MTTATHPACHLTTAGEGWTAVSPVHSGSYGRSAPQGAADEPTVGVVEVGGVHGSTLTGCAAPVAALMRLRSPSGSLRLTVIEREYPSIGHPIGSDVSDGGGGLHPLTTTVTLSSVSVAVASYRTVQKSDDSYSAPPTKSIATERSSSLVRAMSHSKGPGRGTSPCSLLIASALRPASSVRPHDESASAPTIASRHEAVRRSNPTASDGTRHAPPVGRVGRAKCPVKGASPQVNQPEQSGHYALSPNSAKEDRLPAASLRRHDAKRGRHRPRCCPSASRRVRTRLTLLEIQGPRRYRPRSDW